MAILSTVVFGEVTVLDLMGFAVITGISVLIAYGAGFYLKKGLSDTLRKDEMIKIVRLVQILIILSGIFISLPSFHVDFGELLVIGGTAGIIIGFASQRLVTNVGSGAFLMLERPMRIGDSVKIGNTSGTVDDIRILSTTVKTYEGIYVRIPNETVFTSEITNFDANVARRFEYRIRIRYCDDADHAIRLIGNLLKGHPFVLKNPGPLVYVDELGDNGTILMARIWAPSSEWWSVRTEMLGKIKTALEKEGIEIPVPQRVVWFAEKTGIQEEKIGS